MSSKRTFITDLDHTIIHSQYPQHRCVERHADHRPITYMSEYSYHLLEKVLANPAIEVIPCTMRNLFQLQRIDWIQTAAPRLAICSNGAQIYHYGELNQEWEQLMRERTPRGQVQADYQQVCKLKLQAEVQNIDDFYLVVKCENLAYAESILSTVKASFAMRRRVFQSGRKIFIITPEIDKKYAVEYLQTKYELPNILTSGDSEADRKFTTCGQAILPRHATFRHQQARITKCQGISATEEILTYVLNFRV